MGMLKDEEINCDRRGFFGAAAVTIAAAKLGLSNTAEARPRTKSAELTQIKRGKNTKVTSLKQIDAGVLNVGYAEAGPADGPAVLLLQGWPYDIYSYVDVAPALAEAGYRLIIPYARGYGTTRFLATETLRNGQPSALAVDVMCEMIALNVTALTRLTYAAAPGFAVRGGAIINIASAVGIAPEILNGVYGGTKAFVLALTLSLHKELAGKKTSESRPFCRVLPLPIAGKRPACRSRICRLRW
jgi:NAD(P)-dependent dehydrogenase (short-subunit alcohol dehydrogenase family)